MITRLQTVFAELTLRYSGTQMQREQLWQELSAAYAERGRKYHTQAHLENLLQELLAVRSQINDWDAVLFALFYHDAVYNVHKSNNEEKSAELANERMQQLTVPQERISKTVQLIHATKSHVKSGDNDCNLFTDADLSILGASPGRYTSYAQEIRSEYSIYPDLLYKPGRRKVLQHFLAMERIYKTEHFFALYEAQARINLAHELQQL
jgi:predicted metal-dependent HD superfamily phosphohydrolase